MFLSLLDNAFHELVRLEVLCSLAVSSQIRACELVLSFSRCEHNRDVNKQKRIPDRSNDVVPLQKNAVREVS